MAQKPKVIGIMLFETVFSRYWASVKGVLGLRVCSKSLNRNGTMLQEGIKSGYHLKGLKCRLRILANESCVT